MALRRLGLVMATGAALLAIASAAIGGRYQFGAVQAKDDPIWKSGDCAELLSWAVYTLTGRLYGTKPGEMDPARADAWTGWWLADVERIGNLVTIEQAAGTQGACLLRAPGPEAGSVGHLVISDGGGGTVEAHSTARGVIRGATGGRRWTHGIEVPWITYQRGIPREVPPPAGTVYRVTAPMMSGPEVHAIQAALRLQGYTSLKADGWMGPKTAAAVRRYQRGHGLVADGEVGPLTMAALGIAT